jgi:diguanylate cyclase (GGDEF)-like protein
VPPTPHFDFGPYAQILKTLLPRARGIYLYAPDGGLLWSGDGADCHDLRPAVEELLEAAKRGANAPGGLRHMLDEAPAYCFLLRDELGAILGVTAVVCRAVTREGDLPTFEAVERTLSPLLALTRRDLGQQRVIETGRFHIGDTQELEWLLDVTQLGAPAGGGDPLQGMLDAFAAHADCDLAFLYAPGRRLERSATRCTLGAGELDTLRGVVSRHLHKVAHLQQKTLIVNKVRDTGAGGLVPFRILCVPLVRRGQAVGVAVAFNRAESRSFGTREARMLERVAPRLLEIIDARIDATTGLLTRHAFDEHAASLLADTKDGLRALVYADIDELRLINDLYGLDSGDAVLRAVADGWRTLDLPGASATARVASDRFVALLDGCTLDAAHGWAESARHAVGSIQLPGRLAGVRTSMSFGVAALPSGGTLEHALAGAESACRLAKDKGRNRVEVFVMTEGRGAEQQREVRVYHELLEAFEHGRLRLYAQPLTPLWDPSRAERYEVLVRLQDARGQVLPAEQFIDVARRRQMLPRLDEWVLLELLRRLGPCAAALEQAGAVFSVNVSSQSLQQPGLAERVEAAIRATPVPPRLLSFEISESAVVGRLADTERFVTAIGELGCQSSIDDFGTGLTSLAHLKALKVSALKIDGVFIADLLREPRSESMVRAILHIARQLELDTVAECIESKEAASQLATLGVTYGQGTALGEPRPLAEVLDGVARKSAPRLTDAVAHAPADKRVH